MYSVENRVLKYLIRLQAVSSFKVCILRFLGGFFRMLYRSLIVANHRVKAE